MGFDVDGGLQNSSELIVSRGAVVDDAAAAGVCWLLLMLREQQ